MYKLYTDGSGHPSSRKSGWGFILIGPEGEQTGCGCEHGLHVNRMELLAIVKGLQCLPEQSCDVTIYTDSLYVTTRLRKKVKLGKHVGQTWLDFHRLRNPHDMQVVRIGNGTGLRPVEHKRAHDLARDAVFNFIEGDSKCS